MTPFEEAGYNEETKFRVLVDWVSLNKDDIVTLGKDDGSSTPYFTTKDGRVESMFLPGEGYYEELEAVNEEPSKTLYSSSEYHWSESLRGERDIIDQNWDGESKTFTLYAAELKAVKASELFTTKAVGELVDSATDKAHDEFDEYASNWDFEAGKLINDLKGFIDEWFDKNKCQPTFFGVENVRPITYKVWMIDENSFDYREVKNDTV